MRSMALAGLMLAAVHPPLTGHGPVIQASTPTTCGSDDDPSAAEKPAHTPAAQLPGGRTGSRKGDYVPTFYSRVVTGPLMNKSVCYVCRNGSRPVVMVVMRTTGPEIGLLLRNIERIVDRRRAAGVRCVGVMISKNPVKCASQVQTFAFNTKLEMPLTVATEAVALPDCLNIPDASVATVLMYENRTVVEAASLKTGDLTKDAMKRLLKRVQKFADRGL